MKAKPSGCSRFCEPLKSCVTSTKLSKISIYFHLRMIYKNVQECETNPRKIHEPLPNKSFHQTTIIFIYQKKDIQKLEIRRGYLTDQNTIIHRLYHNTFFIRVENPTVRSSNMFKLPTQSLIPQKTGQPCCEYRNPIFRSSN
ncbi:hypothetical protein D8674_025711 [Pyrus ussuriensis x Pyrus communis]|uniref:Uncharacterized protein n=1 Tax=Pyrus ussuriensis x Pyrus communis TaxID=2448454 RepID=A0A5N5I7I7_9ROSA|nr:hypothetical protein D8674_025711 [Pyrus ussuriensis x Pyrus communis]